MGKKPKKKSGSKPPIRKSRKEMRKEQRKEKKLKRSMKHQWQNPQTNATSDTASSSTTDKKFKVNGPSHPKVRPDLVEELRKQEKAKQKVLQAQMEKNRRKQLLVANKEEDKNIRHLEKLLFTRWKPKTNFIPKSFNEDGLGYLLEVCDREKLKDSVKVDQVLQDSGSEFEEDFALVRGKKKEKKSKTNKKLDSVDESNEDDKMEAAQDSGSDFGLGVDDDSDEDMSAGDINDDLSEDEDMSETEDVSEEEDMPENGDTDTEEDGMSDDEVKTFSPEMVSRSKQNRGNISGDKMQKSVVSNKKESAKRNSCPLAAKKKVAFKKSEDESDDFDTDEQFESDQEDENAEETSKGTKSDKTWEDIYGRLRDKEGNVVDAKPGKYIPPALRAKPGNEDEKRKEMLARLRRQMKGLTNRLAENNMTSICTQMDELFMKNSRNDMNETLLNLILEALVTSTLTPERLVMEHMLLIAVLHANVGTEVGAHILQNLMKKFQEMIDSSPQVENKELDNVLLTLSHLYNFKVFSASLMYEVLDKVADSLDEKRIELLLLVLRSVGFSLRKDDPLALKNLILKVQEKANCTSASSTNSRVKFMLDILMAIKNNNVSKIPSYNPEHIEHLKKLLRTLVRRGNYVTELKISLDDVLKAEERGRWWIVGSAWTGHLPGENPDTNPNLLAMDSIKSRRVTESTYSAQLLELARKQRMNTDVRRDIFCILMTSEDYLDAFEKLLHLNLKNQQRQEIVSVLFDCCLQEKSFNPYYAHLSQKFCDFDRQYQMKFQYCLWDKLKELNNLQNSQLINMAKLLAYLFLEKGLPLSALKVISFAEMDKPCVRIVRQILLLILLSEELPKCEAVFKRIAPSPQLHLFREGLRLFINHFVVKKGSKSLPKEEFELLQDRAKMAEKALSVSDTRLAF